VAKSYSSRPTHGADFCAHCGMPGQWLTRPQLMEWLRSNVKASVEIRDSERLELIEVLTKIEAMKADDDKTVAACQMVRGAVPKVWERAKPVLDAVIADAVKKYLGL
jgi:hypothetical protein